MLAFFSCAIPKWCFKQLVTLIRETEANGVYSSSVYDTLHMPGFEMAFFHFFGSSLSRRNEPLLTAGGWLNSQFQHKCVWPVRVCRLAFQAFGRFVLF